ncbi:MAG: hypothetical protein K6V73_04100 [Firmicutes bacterium]|nr:hypothetical protein [Bacillota bacterium]
MLGVRVQRWTLRYFAVALAALALALALVAAGVSYPAAPILAPATLVTVHLLTLGWLTPLMLGALSQLVPVITRRQLASDGAPGPALALLVVGLGAMLVGFLALGGGPLAAPFGTAADLALPIGGALVVSGVGVNAVNLAVTLWRARPLPLSGRYAAAALAFLAATVLLGLTLAATLTVPTLLPPVLAATLAGEGLPFHVLAGVGGWFTLTAMGVGLKLLAMFTLAPEERGRSGDAAFLLTAVGLGLAFVAGLAATFAPAARALGMLADMGLGAATLGVAVFVADMAIMYRQRRRRALELNARFGAWALALLALALGWGLVARLAGGGMAAFAPVVALALMGWLSGLGLSQLYKIVPFLTWIERYGARMGRERVPRVQDLVREGQAKPWFVLWFVGALVLSLAVAAPAPDLARASALALLIALAGIAWELAHSRRVRPEILAAGNGAGTGDSAGAGSGASVGSNAAAAAAVPLGRSAALPRPAPAPLTPTTKGGANHGNERR